MLFNKMSALYSKLYYTLGLVPGIKYKKVNGKYLPIPDIEQLILFSEHYLFKTTQLSYNMHQSQKQYVE